MIIGWAFGKDGTFISLAFGARHGRWHFWRPRIQNTNTIIVWWLTKCIKIVWTCLKRSQSDLLKCISPFWNSYPSALRESWLFSMTLLCPLVLIKLVDWCWGSSGLMGLGRWPIPVGCCKPAACSSAPSTDTTAWIVASSSWDHGLEGQWILLKNKLCQRCLSWNTMDAIFIDKGKGYQIY